MPILFDNDQESGMQTFYDYDPIKDQAFLTYKQDVTHFLDRMQALRNNPDIWNKGVKEEWALYCSIPESVEIALMNKGLYLHNRHQHKEIFKEINTNYPHLRATDKWHR